MSFPASFNYGFTNSIRSVKLANGNFCVYGETFGVYVSNPTLNTPRFNVLEFDGNDNFVSGYSVLSTQTGNPAVDRIRVDQNKRALFTIYQNLTYPDADILIGSIANGKLLNQRKKEYRNKELFWHNAEIFGDGSYVFANVFATVGQSNFYLEYSRLHNSDTGSVCLGLKSDFSTIAQTPYIPYSFNWAQIIPNPITVTSNQNNTSTPISYIFSPPCTQKASCDTLKIHGVTSACDFQQEFIYTCYRDYRCGMRVNWTINPAVVQIFQVLNDTTVKIRLNQPWQGWLYAEINSSCGIITDSLFITISPSPGAVNLGADQQLCSGNTIILNAHAGYATYLWNTGATDSVLTVNATGQYYVDVTDACGNFFSDTVIINAAPPVPLNLGPDRIKCNNDTLHIDAPGGFIAYNWGPNYNISSLTSQNVIVQPAVDTIYYVKAEKTPGCFAFDTIRISVKYSPPINLGPDRSFCTGDSAILNAGPGFNQYQWNTGSSNSQLTV